MNSVIEFTHFSGIQNQILRVVRFCLLEIGRNSTYPLIYPPIRKICIRAMRWQSMVKEKTPEQQGLS